jgi:IS5 family transposase
VVTTASVHDSQIFEELTEEGDKRAVYADSAYRSDAHETMLAAEEFESQIHERAA